MRSKTIWMNGKLVPYAEATLHFLTPGLHYGMGVFEGIRSYATDRGPAIFRLREHVRRLELSARILGWKQLPFSEAELMSATKLVVAANGLSDCYIRPLVYLAEGGWNLNIANTKPHIGIAVWEWKAYLGAEAMENGVRANIASFTRHHPNVMMTKAKVAGNYVNSFLAKSESVRLGYDEAIMLDPQGYVAECTGENLFVVRKNKICTVPTAPVLDGITRDALMTLASDHGYQVTECPLSRDQLYAADEVFVCGTAAEVIALREIDDRVIGAGTMGPVTRTLQRAYADAIRGKHARSPEWLDYVGPHVVEDQEQAKARA
jgi:branched-chain amino acid aminotransferase